MYTGIRNSIMIRQLVNIKTDRHKNIAQEQIICPIWIK